MRTAGRKGVINDAVFYQRNQRLEFEVPSASQAASEAWRTWRTQLSLAETWKIRADVVVPLSWNSGSEDEHQIGVGPWVGKPGGDTNYVLASIPPNTSSVSMEVMYCSDDRSLSIYYDGDNRVDTQPVDDTGLFRWNIGPVFDVGMIGFAEGPSATSDFPYLDNWEVFEGSSSS